MELGAPKTLSAPTEDPPTLIRRALLSSPTRTVDVRAMVAFLEGRYEYCRRVVQRISL